MKKTVLTFGLISGAILSVLMLANVTFIDKIGFDRGLIVGYTTMVIAFLLVFFGVRSYRENVGGGEISFGKAFSVGILITLICCICYVVTWEIAYFTLLSDFGEKYANYMVESARAAGASAAEIAAEAEKGKDIKNLLDNPFYNAAFSFLEPLPVGLLFTLISALLLRKRRQDLQDYQDGVKASPVKL